MGTTIYNAYSTCILTLTTYRLQFLIFLLVDFKIIDYFDFLNVIIFQQSKQLINQQAEKTETFDTAEQQKETI